MSHDSVALRAASSLEVGDWELGGWELIRLGPTSSLWSSGTRAASPAAPLRDCLQVESFVQKLLFLGLRECGQSIFVCEPISGCGSPRAEDDQRDARVILADAHRY
jgi:hypothetical protein